MDDSPPSVHRRHCPRAHDGRRAHRGGVPPLAIRLRAHPTLHRRQRRTALRIRTGCRIRGALRDTQPAGGVIVPPTPCSAVVVECSGDGIFRPERSWHPNARHGNRSALVLRTRLVSARRHTSLLGELDGGGVDRTVAPRLVRHQRRPVLDLEALHARHQVGRVHLDLPVGCLDRRRRGGGIMRPREGRRGLPRSVGAQVVRGECPGNRALLRTTWHVSRGVGVRRRSDGCTAFDSRG